VKNDLCLFDRPLKIQNGVFLFEISFFVLEILPFFYFGNAKIPNKRYLCSVFETWHHNCASKRKQNDTLSAVTMATVSAPVSFCQKTKYPYLQPLK